jgi:hypothetical protein
MLAARDLFRAASPDCACGASLVRDGRHNRVNRDHRRERRQSRTCGLKPTCSLKRYGDYLTTLFNSAATIQFP